LTLSTTVFAASAGSIASPADEFAAYRLHAAPIVAAVASMKNARTLSMETSRPVPPVITTWPRAKRDTDWREGRFDAALDLLPTVGETQLHVLERIQYVELVEIREAIRPALR